MDTDTTILVEDLLQEAWDELRNSLLSESIAYAEGQIWAAWKLGHLTKDGHELWLRRILTCPGHDATRCWCAYCGDVIREEN